jgi:hypothetical protein
MPRGNLIQLDIKPHIIKLRMSTMDERESSNLHYPSPHSDYGSFLDQNSSNNFPKEGQKIDKLAERIERLEQKVCHKMDECVGQMKQMNQTMGQLLQLIQSQSNKLPMHGKE